MLRRWSSRITIRLLIKSLSRLLVLELLLGGIGLGVVYREYQRFWQQSIQQQQTTIHNTLGNMLPTALSVAIDRQDRGAVRALLDGNYGLYSLVLTNSEGEQILETSRDLREQAASEIWPLLLSSPFDAVYDPPALPGQASLPPDFVGPPPSDRLPGLAIARIYYLSAATPNFWQELGQWWRYPDKMQGRFQTYTTTLTFWLIGGLTLGIALELLRQKRQALRKELAQSQQSQVAFKQEARQLRFLLTERSAQNTFLIERLQVAREDQESLLRQHHQEVLVLQSAIAEYETQIESLDAQEQPDHRDWQQELRRAKEKLRELQQREAQAGEKVRTLSQKIERLTKQRDDAQQRLDHLSQQPETDELTLEAARLEIEQQQALANYAIEETTHLESEKEELAGQILQLQERNNHLIWRNQELEYRLEALEHLGHGAIGEEEDADNGAIPLSHLANISARATTSALERLGFTLDHQKGSHLIMKRHTEVEQSCCVPSKNEIRPPTLKHILNQAGVSLEEFQGALK